MAGVLPLQVRVQMAKQRLANLGRKQDALDKELTAAKEAMQTLEHEEATAREIERARAHVDEKADGPSVTRRKLFNRRGREG